MTVSGRRTWCCRAFGGASIEFSDSSLDALFICHSPVRGKQPIAQIGTALCFTAPRSQPPAGDNGLGLKEIARRAAREAERAVLEEVLDQVHWNRVQAARRLKISYKALLYKIRGHGLEQ